MAIRPPRHSEFEALLAATGTRDSDPLPHQHPAPPREREKRVGRRAERHTEPLSVCKLSSWALEMTASALALLRDGVLVLANSRWHALTRRRGTWGWRSGGAPEDATHAPLPLREVALREARLVLERQAPRVTRYQQERGAQVLEVRTEQVAAPMGGLVRVLARDVTEEVKAEQALERAQVALAEREHLHVLGERVSGIAHDLNSTLNAMRLRLELLLRDPTLSRSSAHLDVLLRIVADAGTRVSRLQAFARQQPEDPPERVRLHELVRDAVDIARGDIEHRAAREGVTVRLDMDTPTLPPVKGSAADLRFVFINLLLNARDAMPRGGTIRVRGRHQHGQVILTVEDEGTGIPPEHLRDIFRPFFTTKGQRGTGLGLSRAHDVVARAGGTLTAANRRRGGAVLTLAFPVAEPPPRVTPARRKARPTPAPVRRGGRPRPVRERT